MSELPPFGTRAYDAVAAAKKVKEASGGKFLPLEAKMIIEDLFQAEISMLNGRLNGLETRIKLKDQEIERIKVSTRKPAARVPRADRPRNPLFDTLAVETGVRLEQATRTKCKEVATALADIKAVCPDLTPEELKKRAKNYRDFHPTWHLSAPALAKHWSTLGGGAPTRPAQHDIYQEPKADWRKIASSMPTWRDRAADEPSGYFDGQPWFWSTIKWLDVATYLRVELLQLIYPQ